MRTFKVYSPGNFQIYKMLSLTMVTVLYTRPAECARPGTGSLYQLISISHLLPAARALAVSHPSALCFCEFGFFRFHIHVTSHSISLPSLSTMPSGHDVVATSSVSVFLTAEWSSTVYIYQVIFTHPSVRRHMQAVPVSSLSWIRCHEHGSADFLQDIYTRKWNCRVLRQFYF